MEGLGVRFGSGVRLVRPLWLESNALALSK